MELARCTFASRELGDKELEMIESPRALSPSVLGCESRLTASLRDRNVMGAPPIFVFQLIADRRRSAWAATLNSGKILAPIAIRKGISMNTSRLVASAIAAAVALPSLALAAGPAPVPAYTSEKCYGIASGGANDCGTASHSCAGQSARAKDPASWLYVPAGTCVKIDGGSLTSKS
jgi:uncharacterized membrane protein